jgi:hypothetical protein
VPVRLADATTNLSGPHSTTTNTTNTTNTFSTTNSTTINTSRQFDIRGYFPNDVIPVVRFISAILEPELPTTTKKAKIAIVVRYCDLSQAVRSSQVTAAFKYVSTPFFTGGDTYMQLKRQRSYDWIIPSTGNSHASTSHNSSRNGAYSMILSVATTTLIENCSWLVVHSLIKTFGR